MATAAQRKAYERKLRQISRNFDRLERATLRQSIKLLRDVRDKIAGHLTGSEFSQFRVAEQQKALDAIIAEYEEQARAMANGAARKSYQLGGQSAIDPLKAAGVNVSFFRPSKAQVEVLAQFSADLLGDYIDGKMKADINRIIRMNALGGNSSLDAMKEITVKMFGDDRKAKAGDPTRGVAYEAERILRTETNRSYNLASFSQMEKLAKDVPGLQKQWMATGDSRTRLSHLQAHGKIVDVGDPFIVGGQELMYPLDPRGGAAQTINCRCTFGTVIPEIGPIESPLDKEIEDEKAARGVGAEKTKQPGDLVMRPNMSRDEQIALNAAVETRLTDKDKRHFRKWGQSGLDVRKNQQDNIPTVEWDTAVNKTPIYNGVVHRGLSEVPNEAINDWIHSKSITLNNDQSATLDVNVGSDFVGGNRGRVLWEIDQKTGRYIGGNTSVTYGGKSVHEAEVLIRKGAKYKVQSVDFRYNRRDVESIESRTGKWPSYVDKDTLAFISDDYFEGESFSWPNNPPPKWDIGRDTLGTGTYHFKLVEVE